MTSSIINSFQSEWLKTKGSLALWIVVIGSLFTPTIVIIVRLVQYKSLPKLYALDGFWKLLWKNSWESMAIFLLPLGVILATSLITQIEYKNNTWKQLHTLPLTFTTTFFTKLAVTMVMMLQFFILFNVGIYLSALVPYLLIQGVPYPKGSIPLLQFLQDDLYFFIDCLPIIALQYLLSLQFKNFLVPVGVGFILWVGALASLSWKFGYVIPYTYCMYYYLTDITASKAAFAHVNIHWMAIGYFVLITIVSYVLYLTKKEKG